MTDFADDDFNDPDDNSRRFELRRRMRTEGIEAAFEAAMVVCKDPKAPHAAKASVISSLFRAGDCFGQNGANEGVDKGLGEMSADELKAASAKARAAIAALGRRGRKPHDDNDESGGGVFG